MNCKVLLPFLLLGCVPACADNAKQEPDPEAAVAMLRMKQCFEVAHRIACNATGECQENETEAGFERRHQTEMMIGHLCTDGPQDFDEYYWIDIDGKYRPYYTDVNGNKSKIPPSSP